MNNLADRSRLGLLLLGISSTVAFAATANLDPTKPISRYQHDAWTIEQGLPQNTVPAIAQTRDGYLWLGTEAGLVRFDGVRFTVFDKTNTPALKNNFVYALLEDKEGNLWIGTQGGGLTRYSHGIFETFTSKNGLSNDVVLCLLQDRAGTLWIGTEGGGLVSFRSGVFRVYDVDQGLVDSAVWGLAEDADGSLWIGTHGGLNHLKNGKFEIYQTKDGLPNDYIRCLLRGSNGELWIGTNGGGLVRFSDGKFSVFSTKDGLSNNGINSLNEDSNGSLWIGTIGGGLNRFTHGKFTFYSTDDGLTGSSIWTMFRDRSGDLWVGTSGGLDRFTDSIFVTYSAKEGLSSDVILPVHEDSAGNIWIGSHDGGVNRLRNGEITKFTTKQGLASDSVFSLASDRTGVWIGTRAGLNRFENGKFTLYGPKDGLPNSVITALKLDSRGVLWIGTKSGLSEQQNGRFVTYTTKHGLSNNAVNFVEEDHLGNLWIGTSGGGLSRLSNGKFSTLNAKQGLSNDVVLSFHEDGQGVIWVGTSGGGLNRIEAGHIKIFGVRNGFPDDTITQVLEDGAGNLWFGSNRGIFRASLKELNAFAAGKSKSFNVSSYGTADGMKSRECNGGYHPAGWKGKDGRLWFATMKGAVVVDPAAMGPVEEAPPVLIEEATIDRNAVSTTQAVSAAPGQGELEFRYTALGFRSPQKITFRYKLEGFDTDWVDADTRRTAYYTNIPPGTYRFVVIARNRDGVWNNAGASLKFSLAPHYYQATWFRLSCFLSLLGLVIGGHLSHVRRLQEKERVVSRMQELTNGLRSEIAERERVESDLITAKDAAEQASRVKSDFLANMSHELRTPMNGVLGMTELALGTDLTNEQREYLTVARNSADSLLTIIDDILDFSKIEAGKLELNKIDFDLPNLMEETVQFLSVQAHKKKLELLCDVRPDLPEIVRGDPDRLRQVIVNLLGNAVKFTERGEVVIEVGLESRNGSDVVVHFVVRDTGIGIPPEKREVIFKSFSQADTSSTRRFGGTGLGLAISLRLVNLMEGRLWVDSELGVGSQFHFTIPFQEPVNSVLRPRSKPPGVDGIKVLVVDDNATCLKILTKKLTGWGMKAIPCTKTVDALEVLARAAERSDPFPLIITDFDLAETDGLAFLENARCHVCFAGASIVLHTTGACWGDPGRTRDLGVMASLTKPVRTDDLALAVQKALAGERRRFQRNGAQDSDQDLSPATFRVLLTEDNLINQKLALRLLENRGHRVFLAVNGREALDAVQKHEFDVVLMDLQMPVMGGLEATAAIREREKGTGKRLPIIAVTANTTNGEEEECLRVGMDGFIAKPVHPATLYHVMESVVLYSNRASLTRLQ